MKDIDPFFRRKSSLKNSIAEKIGYDALVLALKDVLETEEGENPEDPDRGTNITTDYLSSAANIFDAMIIKDKIYYAIKNYLPFINIDEDGISVVTDFDNGEYVVYLDVSEGKTTESEKPLTFTLKIVR